MCGTIKPLVFNKYDEAKGCAAKYIVYETGSGWNAVCCPHEETLFLIAEDVSPDAAKAAVQADHEARIADLIQPDVKPLTLTVARVQVSKDYTDLIERLDKGLQPLGLAEDNATELYDIEDVNELLFEAFEALRALTEATP